MNNQNREFHISFTFAIIAAIIGFILTMIIDSYYGIYQFTNKETKINNLAHWESLIRENYIIFFFLLLIIAIEPVIIWLIYKSPPKTKRKINRMRKTGAKAIRWNKTDAGRNKKPQTKPPIDRWTYRHFLGSLIVALFVPGLFLLFFIGSSAFEIFEHRTSTTTNVFRYRYEQTSNQIIDIIANMLGYYAGSWISEYMGNPLSLI